MKKFIIHCSVFGLIFIAIVIAFYLLTPVNHKNYLYEINHKFRLLDSVPSPRIIFVGGSNVAFGVDSKAISDSLGINIINTGLHAGLGLKYQLESVVDRLKPGDIIVIMPEYEQFYNNFFGQDNVISQTVKCQSFRNIELMDFNQLVNIIKGAPKIAYSDLTGRNRIDSAYSSINFNEYGDEIHHRSKKRQDKVQVFTINEEADEEVIETFSKKVNEIRSNGYKVIILPPVTLEKKYKLNKEKIDRLYSLMENAGVPFQSKVEIHMLPDTCAFDTEYHLSDEGVRLLTPRLVKEIRGIVPELQQY